MKLLSFFQIPTGLEQRGKCKPVWFATIENHFSVENYGLKRGTSVCVTSNDGITSISGGIGDLGEDKAGVMEATRIFVESTEGDDFGGNERVEEMAGS